MSTQPKIDKNNIAEICSLTSLQEGMLFHHLEHPDSRAYSVRMALDIAGNMNLEKCQDAWLSVINKYEVLRTVFRWEEITSPIQIVLKNIAFVVTYKDFSALELQNEQLDKLMPKFNNDVNLNLTTTPFLVFLYKLSDQRFIMEICHHHILYDGWSNGILINDFFAAYINVDQPAAAVVAKPSLKDYSTAILKQNNTAGLNYWSSYVKDYIHETGLSANLQSQPGNHNYADYKYLLPEDLGNRLTSFAKNNNITIAAILYAAWGLMLQKRLNSNMVVFGTTVAGRNLKLPNIEQAVGLFINTLPLKISADNGKSLKQLLIEVNGQLQERESFENFPLVEIKRLALGNGTAELFDSIMVIENYPLDNDKLKNNNQVNVTGFKVIESTHYNLTVTFSLFEKAELCFNYNLRYWSDKAIGQLNEQFITVLNALVNTPEMLFGKLRLVSDEQKHLLLKAAVDIESSGRIKSETIIDLFKKNVIANPADIAVKYNNVELTYWQLHDRARQIASWILSETGLSPGSKIGFMLERDEHMVPLVFGLLESGMVYVPIVHNLPSDVINYIIKDAGIEILLASGKLLPKGLTPSVRVVDLDKQISIINNYQGLINNFPVHQDKLAAIIYNTNFQNKAKGVMITHAQLSAGMIQMQHACPLKRDDVVLLKSQPDSHFSLEELFGWVIAGASVAILPSAADFKIAELINCIARDKVTAVNFTPAILTKFCTALSNNMEITKLQSLRYVFTGDGALYPNQAEFFNKTVSASCNAVLIAKYGCLETSGTVAFYKYAFGEENNTIRIGKAVESTLLYILNSDGELVSEGVAGEIAILGLGVATGYLNNEMPGYDEQIMATPYLNGQKLFKTGDLGKWLPDGTIQYLGTTNDIVNIQNLRVNLNRAEQQLSVFDNVLECVVLLKHTAGKTHIIAYYSAAQKLKQSELKKYLSDTLPDYLVPAHFVHLYEMPLTANGKINKAALLEMQVNISDQFTSPANDMETSLVALWAKVLKIKEEVISVTSSFFDLGGHSLRATTVLNNIRKEFGIKISYNDFVKNPTIRDLASHIGTTEDSSYTPILQAAVQPGYPLSLAQRRLFFLYQLDKNQTAYNMSFMVRFHQVPDVERLTQAFQALINRHEILRTSFEFVNDEPRQTVIPFVKFALSHRKMVEGPLQQAIQEFIKPFDLNSGPLFRAGIIETTDNQYFLITDMHHIISDGVSGSIILQELAAFYNNLRLPELKLQYKDYAVWQADSTYKARLKQQRDFWLNEFEEVPAPLELPLDFLRPVVKKYTGNRVTLELTEEESLKIATISEKHNSSIFIVLLSAYSILLSKLSGQEDLVIGCPVAGRRHADLENMLGMFVNTLPLRSKPAGHITIKSYINRLKDLVLTSLDNQDYPYEDLIDELGLERDTSRNPLFDAVFSYENFEETNLHLNGNIISEENFNRGISKFDLTLSATKKDNLLTLTFEYADAFFENETVKRYLVYLKRIVLAMYADTDAVLSSIQLIDEAERLAIVACLDNTQVNYPAEETICSLFEKQALQNPDRIAISFGKKTITYREVLKQSNMVAAALRKQGVKPNTIVALLMDRSVETVIGMLGILKAGGAYLPIDTDYPEDRINYLIEDSGADVILTSDRFNKVFKGQEIVIEIETILKSNDATHNLQIVNQPQDACYIIYTSGTTGKPKGVVIEHRNVVRLFFNDAFQFKFSESDVWTMFHSHCFDFSVWEMYGALLFGGKLVIISKYDAIDTGKYLDILLNEKVTVLNQTPSAFYNLVHKSMETNADLSALRYVIFGGEALSPQKLKQWNQRYPYVKLINMFGITETTVHVTYREVTNVDMDTGISNVGTPIPTLSVYLLDKYQNIVPPNVNGEIYVGGMGVARGYLKRDALTAERFVAHPFKPGEKIYRSGDMARLLNDGTIEYLGRADEQVKIRGFRIELGEIESNVISYPQVQEAAVIVREYSGEKYIVAYYIASQPIEASSFKNFLRAKIPEHMIPSYFLKVEKLLLNHNSKLDKKALPDPTFKVAEASEKPKNQVQKELIKIWSETLNIPEDRVGIQTNFFDIGGNSLKLVKMVNKINNHFSSNIPVIKAFTYPVISLLANYLETELPGNTTYNTAIIDNDVEQMTDTINLLNRFQD